MRMTISQLEECERLLSTTCCLQFNEPPASYELAVKQLDRIWDNSATSNIGDIIILRNGRPLTEEMRDIIKRYDSISIEEDRIEELEYSYKVASIRDKMLVKLINLSINTNNRKIVNAAFSSGSPQEVVSFINNELYELSKIALMEKWC